MKAPSGTEVSSLRVIVESTRQAQGTKNGHASARWQLRECDGVGLRRDRQAGVSAAPADLSNFAHPARDV
jgi:hypothetical protein